MSDETWVVTLPKLGESVTEGVLGTFFKNVGDEVEFDDPLFEVSTDKVDTEVPSSYDGVVLEVARRARPRTGTTSRRTRTNASLHVPNPSRIHRVTRASVEKSTSTWPTSPTAQLELISSDTPSRDELVRRLPDAYVDRRRDADAVRGHVRDRALGRQRQMVQVKVGHRRVPAYAKRDRVDFADVPYTYRTIGWRKAVRGEAGGPVGVRRLRRAGPPKAGE